MIKNVLLVCDYNEIQEMITYFKSTNNNFLVEQLENHLLEDYCVEDASVL